MTETVYFASDTHFGAMAAPRERARIERFLNWLQGLEDGSELILLGDIFDFWLDYPTFMPKTHLEILYGLRKLQDRGCRISFVGGNHDIWCADFLREQLDIPILAGGTVIERQGRKLRLDHGDGILSGDIFYRGFRAAVRNPLLVFLAKSLHPEILNWLANQLSNASRKKGRERGAGLDEAIGRYGEQHDHSDVDYLVIGHIHHPCNRAFDSWRLVCLGDWVQHHTYGRLRAGELEVLTAPDLDGEAVSA